MAGGRYLDATQARDIEEELFATRRQQASRHMPVSLPRQNFWEMVGKLLADIDSNIQDMIMNGITVVFNFISAALPHDATIPASFV